MLLTTLLSVLAPVFVYQTTKTIQKTPKFILLISILWHPGQQMR